jgi:AcrR family transcriptional regulator
VPSPARGLTQPQRLEISGHRLIQAAAELIVEKGWEATTAAEIGRRAGYSRAMVHARFGNKDAILDTLFRDEYTKKLSPTPDPDAPGLIQALAHFDRISELLADDRDFLRAMFVLGFEAVKKTSPVRRRMRAWVKRGTETVEAGLTLGMSDGSVRSDVDLDRAVHDISAVVFGLAYQWIVFAGRYDLGRELAHARARIIADYGSGAAP